MNYTFPKQPCDKSFTHKPQTHKKININQQVFPYAETILFSHTIEGKKICGYNQNGKQKFAYIAPKTAKHVLIEDTNIFIN